jgi:hypothetical protein
MGTHETAVRIERQPSVLPPNLRYARAAARLYAELFDVTGDEDYRICRESYSLIVADLKERDHETSVAVLSWRLQ